MRNPASQDHARQAKHSGKHECRSRFYEPFLDACLYLSVCTCDRLCSKQVRHRGTNKPTYKLGPLTSHTSKYNT
eukprot:1450435-Pleurochrysis_carterae.AAC.2